MRSSPVFQPALNSVRTVSQRKACDQGLTFAAHYPADDYAASLASGAARLELWTDLPVSQVDAASTSRSTAWSAVPLQPLRASVGNDSGYTFAAAVKCSEDAADGAFGFTYRIVHPDGKIDWLGSPSNDGQIYLPCSQLPRYTFAQLVQPHSSSDLKLSENNSASAELDSCASLASLVASRRQSQGSIAFSINANHVQAGIVVERTKSTWCTSRRFRSLDEVSADFGSNLIILELSQSPDKEVLVILPVFEDGHPPARMVRGSSDGDNVNFEIVGAGAQQAKVVLALGTLTDLKQVIAACRSHAARTLRTSIHEPLGLSWSAKKLLDSDSSLSFDAIVPSLPYAYEDSEFTDASFFSDSTAVDSSQTSLSSASSMILPPTDDAHAKREEQDDTSTVNGDRTFQAETQPQPPQPQTGLGFCTWEAMQNDERRPYLSEVVAALEAAESRLGQGSIVALLIDDGWQDVARGVDDRGRLNSFDMDPLMLDLDEASVEEQEDLDTLPVSNCVLARYTSYIRKRFPSIRSIGCWMSLAGYWDGVHPGGPIAAGLSAPLRHAHIDDPFRHASRDWFVPATELDMHLFWDRAFHSLRHSGVDFVKIDAQAEWEWIQDETTSVAFGRHATSLSAASLSKAAFEAMEGAATRYFGASGGVIHSMAFTSNFTNTLRTLPSRGMTIRSTDDFFPRIPEAHRHHLAHNVYNSLLLPEHVCDADMLSHCSSDADNSNDTEYTGYHASFRAFTDARLWISDKTDAPRHTGLRALVAPPSLSGEEARIAVQASGKLLAGTAFEDLIGDGPGPALKLGVQHEGIASATVGFWNLRADHAETFDVVDLDQMLDKVDSNDQLSGSLFTYYAVRSFRSGKIWLLTSDQSQGGRLLGVNLAADSWEVLTIAPMLTTMVEGVRVAFLGSSEHFMTPEGVRSITIATLNPDKESRRRSYLSHSRRPSHHRRRSTRSISTDGSLAFIDLNNATKDESSLTVTAVDNLMQRSDGGAKAVILSLALINGLFAFLHTTITGVVRVPNKGKGSIGRRGTAGVDIVDTMVGMLDKLQTLFVFGLLVLASWTSTLPKASTNGGKRASWLSYLDRRQIPEGEPGLDGKTLRRVRLRPADAVATLKRCLTSRTIVPLRDCPISLTEPHLSPSKLKPLSPRVETPRTATTSTTTDVVVTALVDVAAKISFLVLCADRDSIKTCKIDRSRYECASTPWIRIEEVFVEGGSVKMEGKALSVEVDMRAWKENQDVTFLQSLSGPVSVALRISGSC
ncbi:raffinose synthase protein [Pseudozyma hubeiensis SY62]|uniref:Raffinose synthase protein n=1 Tax=Pseudozyma hubeiensis (strain SY62) TaxID=1305764 RepID=R9P2A6_PSEHS|nr:raffinose synthase protein [Pseudozyma hubeiensis SY62]GAC95518.1 raffinose synthase protein [Pseudozyma hubeiensis SY62]